MGSQLTLTRVVSFDTIARNWSSEVIHEPAESLSGMELSNAQLAEYEREGVLWTPSMFSQSEIRGLRAEIDGWSELEREEIPRSDDGQTHVYWALDGYSEPFRRLLHHPRLVLPAKQILGSDIYQHQFKIVCKTPFGGLPVPWHHDYASWLDNDGMLRPDALNIAVYLDEVTEFNGPLSYVPGSHKAGEDSGQLPTLSYEESGAFFPVIPSDVMSKVIERNGIFGPKGPAGSAVFFHPCMAHGSPASMSPDTRYIVYLTYNRLDNPLTRPKRPWYMGTREPKRIDEIDDACLLA